MTKQPQDIIEMALAQQIDYYRARAPEYDDWFYRRGQHAHGPELNRAWHIEVAELRDALDAAQPSGRVLELAGEEDAARAVLVRADTVTRAAVDEHDLRALGGGLRARRVLRSRARGGRARHREDREDGGEEAERVAIARVESNAFL